jgi:glycosyltransferase involved in cell wall biosynthesis
VAEVGDRAPLRILFVLPSLAGGGAERVILSLVRHLDRRRFVPILAIVNREPNDLAEDIAADVEVIDLGSRRVRYALPALLKLIWRLRPDVLLSTLGHLNLALAMLRPLLPRATACLARETIVVSKEIDNRRLVWLWRWLYVALYRKLDMVICQSHDMQRDLVEHFGVPAEVTRRIPNPVDVERVRLLAGNPMLDASRHLRVIAAGRLVPQKGFDMLIGAVAALKDHPIELVILGDGPLRSTLVQQAVDMGVSSRVHLQGFVPNPYPWFRRADVFVLSSRYEGFPNVVLEALACGTPVIALPAPGGISEILEDVSVCQVAENVSEAALTSAMALWISKGRCRVPPGAIDRFGVGAVLAQYQDLFASVVASRTRRMRR